MIIVNGTDREWTRHRYILSFQSLTLMIWSNSLEGALDELIDYIAECRPDRLCDDEVYAIYREAIARGATEEQAFDESTTDVTCGGNCGHYIPSDDWGIVAEDPTREEVLELMGRNVR